MGKQMKALRPRNIWPLWFLLAASCAGNGTPTGEEIARAPVGRQYEKLEQIADPTDRYEAYVYLIGNSHPPVLGLAYTLVPESAVIVPLARRDLSAVEPHRQLAAIYVLDAVHQTQPDRVCSDQTAQAAAVALMERRYGLSYERALQDIVASCGWGTPIGPPPKPGRRRP